MLGYEFTVGLEKRYNQLKVLQVNVVCGVGSTGRITTDLHNAMLKEGYSSLIAYGRGEGKHCETTIKIGSEFAIYRHVVKTRIFDRHGFGSKTATENFVNEIDKLNPDIIHLHNIHGYYINIEVLFQYLKRANKPIIWTLHDCWSFTGHCAYFDYVECEKWKVECFACPEKKKYPRSLIFDNSTKNYQEKKKLFSGVKNMTIITPSRWLADLTKQSFLGEYPIHVISNGIDTAVFSPMSGDFREKYNLVDKFIILGVASVWEQRKGLNYFIELSQELKKDEVIVLVGVNEKQIKNLSGNIIGITRTNNIKELVCIYSTSDVFVNPTLEDTYSMTNLEALSCGTPVVSFSSGGSAEMLSGKRGFVAKSKDMYGILQGIQEIRLGYEKGLYRETRNDIREFSLERMSQNYIEVYKVAQSKG